MKLYKFLGLSVFVKTPIKELITNVQDNQYDYQEPNLFNYLKNNATAVITNYESGFHSFTDLHK